MHRRHFLAAGAAAPLIVPATARAEQHEGDAVAPVLADAQTFAIGDVRVTVLSDGALRLGADALQGIDAEGYAELMEARFRDPENFRAAVNGFLVEAGDQRMLVDAGSGTAMQGMTDTLGRMGQNLAAVGVAPEDITLLLATHLHPDHVGGAIADGAAVYPNAELVVHEADRDFWSGDAPDGMGDFFSLAQGVLAAYGDRLRTFSGEEEVTSGITAMPLPGHTPGHSGYAITSGDESLLIWADIVHVSPVQLARPEVTIGFDVNPDQAAETRAQILDRVASDRMMIAGSHIDFPGLGHIMRQGEGYGLVDAPYPYRA